RVESWRWAGVPFYIRAGKCLATTATEVHVQLKPPPAVVFHEAAAAMGNHVRFRLGPDVAIGLGGSAKRPGEGMTGQPNELALARQATSDEMDGYGRVAGEGMEGDAAVVARQDGVEGAWEIGEAVLRGGVGPLPYGPGRWGPGAADQLTRVVG